jgi:ribosomal protein L37AE/L43A
MENPEKDVPVCPECKRKTIYFRKDGSVKCRACGYDGPVGGK